MSDSNNEINTLGGMSAMSYSESPLLYYSNQGGNPGVYLEWERYTLTNVAKYNVLRADRIDGTYELIDSVEWPTNEYVDKTGTPGCYYKIQEVDGADAVLTTSQPIIGEELLLKSSLRYELLDLLNVPIYDEEVIFNGNRTKASTAFNFWTYTPRPQIRISSYSSQGDREPMATLSEYDPITKTVNGTDDNYPDGLKIQLDYHGGIHFLNENDEPQAIQPYDTVLASYNVRLFTSAQMNEAMYMALQAVNAQPGADKYPSVVGAPFYYDPAIVYGATYYLLRSLLVGLNQRQKRLILQDPDNGAFDTISSLRETAKMYKEEFDEHLKKLPIAKLPNIKTISVPEFNMPGGRSRFFRYIWGKGGSG